MSLCDLYFPSSWCLWCKDGFQKIGPGSQPGGGLRSCAAWIPVCAPFPLLRPSQFCGPAHPWLACERTVSSGPKDHAHQLSAVSRWFRLTSHWYRALLWRPALRGGPREDGALCVDWTKAWVAGPLRGSEVYCARTGTSRSQWSLSDAPRAISYPWAESWSLQWCPQP